MKFNITTNPQHYTDKYFSRTKQILEAEGLNPFVRAQVFIRRGPGYLAGIDESLELLEQSPLVENGGRVYSLQEDTTYHPKETLMLIEAQVQDIIELETLYLGILSAETTKVNDHQGIDLFNVRDNMQKVVSLANGRPVSYFGARHWHYKSDESISRAAFKGGASSASTDVGAATSGQEGIGTIPHALENIYAFYKGQENAVVESTLAFDRVMDESIPRVALIDYANREITDSIETAQALNGKLSAVRVDTCGENIAQGALELPSEEFSYPKEHEKYWIGTGVTVTGVYALRQGLDAAGFEDVKIMLTSGFGNPEKVEAFVEAENYLGVKLFDGLGVGGIFESRMATMDIVAVGPSLESLVSMSKTGREYSPNQKLKLRLGGRK